MPCYLIGKNKKGFICGKFGDHCSNCGTVSDVLCDYPVGQGKTCDRKICTECANEVAPDVHYCTGHYEEWQKFRSSSGVQKELENVIPFKNS